MKQLLCLSLLGLAPLVLSAQDETGHRFGLSLGAAATNGAIRDFHDGARVDLGLHYLYGFQGGHALRASLHLLGSSTKTTWTAGEKYERSLPGSQLMAEYLYYPGGVTGHGLYVSGGLGIAAEGCNVKYTLKGGSYEKNNGYGTLAPTVGVGYDFTRNLGASLRYVQAAAEPKDPVITFSKEHPAVGTLSAAFRYTF